MASGEYRNLSNQEYWIRRSEEIQDAKWNDIKVVEKELAKQYRIALEEIRQMTIDLITRYGEENKLSYTEARKSLTPIELENYRAKVERLRPLVRQTQDPFLMAELDKLSKMAQLTRLQGLMGEIEARLLELAYQEERIVTDWLSETYADEYYKTIHMIQVGTGIGVSFAKLNERAITEAITMAWSGDQFSDRIWDNKALLVKKLRQTITQGLIKGNSVQKMSKELNSVMDSGYKNSLRLIRTETAYVMGEATAKGYEESGLVETYIFISTLDGRTSSICRKQDNKIFKLKDKQVGVNYPPLHSSCRSTVAVYFKDEDLEKIERIARGEDGQTYYVPANMSYEQWYKKYVG